MIALTTSWQTPLPSTDKLPNHADLGSVVHCSQAVSSIKIPWLDPVFNSQLDLRSCPRRSGVPLATSGFLLRTSMKFAGPFALLLRMAFSAAKILMDSLERTWTIVPVHSCHGPQHMLGRRYSPFRGLRHISAPDSDWPASPGDLWQHADGRQTGPMHAPHAEEPLHLFSCTHWAPSNDLRAQLPDLTSDPRFRSRQDVTSVALSGADREDHFRADAAAREAAKQLHSSAVAFLKHKLAMPDAPEDEDVIPDAAESLCP